MTVKSIVDIDLNDEKFQAFSKLFEKYQAQLAKTPNLWKKVDGATGDAASQFERIAAALMAQNHLSHEIQKESEKGGKTLDRHAKLWSNIHRHTSGILKDVSGIAKFVVGGGIGLGAALAGLGGFGMFGFDRLAESVSNQRNFALGNFMQMGQRKAFSLYAGRNIGNPSGFLTDIAAGLHNVGSPAWNALRTLGVDTNGGTMQVAERALLRIQKLAKSMPSAAVGNLMQMYGLSGLSLSESDLFAVLNLSRSELLSDFTRSNIAARNMANADRTGRGYQNFLSALGSTWGGIRANLVRDLVALTGPLEALSKGLGSAADTFLKGPALKTGIDDLASGLERFAKYVSSAKFENSIKAFVSGTGNLVHGIEFLAYPFEVMTNPKSAGHRIESGISSLANDFAWKTEAKEAARKYGIPISALAGQASASHGLFSPAKVASIDRSLMDKFSFLRSSRERLQAAIAQYWLLQHHSAIGGSIFREMVRENPRGWMGELTPAVTQYVHHVMPIQVEVKNATGSNVHTTLNQLGGSGG